MVKVIGSRGVKDEGTVLDDYRRLGRKAPSDAGGEE